MEITFTISPDGKEVKSDVTGAHGSSCSIVNKVLAKLGRVTLETKKPEYNENVNTNRISQGR